MTTPRKLKAVWTAEIAQDFANFRGNKSMIMPGKDYLKAGTTFYADLPDYCFTTLESSVEGHLFYSFMEDKKFYHPGGVSLNSITIVEDK